MLKMRDWVREMPSNRPVTWGEYAMKAIRLEVPVTLEAQELS